MDACYPLVWSRNNNEWRVALDPVEKTVAFTGGEGVTLQPSAKWARIRSATKLRELSFGPGGRLWIVAGDLVGWNPLEPDLCVRVATGPDDAAHSTSLAVVGSLLVAGLSDGAVLLADSCNGRELRRWRLFNQQVTAVDLAKDRIVAGSNLGEVRIINPETGEVVIDRPSAHRDAVTAIAIGPHGWFVTGSRDHTVKLWDPAGQLVLTLPQTRAVRRVFWSADGSELTILAEGERGLRRWCITELRASLRELGIESALP
jgi:WD40 repeat protein